MCVETQALRWFQQVADGVTLTEISELEMVSQPGVSRALARLETQVGTPLLRRSGRVLRLTRAGGAFKRHVDALIHSLDDGLAAVEQLIDPESGTVSVAFQPSLGAWLVPRLVSTFTAAHPGVRFELRAKADERVPEVGDRTDGDLELSTLPPQPGYRWAKVATEPLRLVVAAGHPLADAPDAALAELREEPFVLIHRHSILRSEVEELCHRTGFAPLVAHVAQDLPTIRGFVANGMGVSVIPAPWSGSAEPAHPGIRYVPISDPGAHRDIRLVWSRERRLLPSAELFKDHVMTCAAPA